MNKKIRLPEDIDTVIEVLQLYNDSKRKGNNKSIDEYDSPGAIRKELSKEVDREGYDVAELVGQDGVFKLYRIDDWDQGQICFSDSGWCVRHQNNLTNMSRHFLW